MNKLNFPYIVKCNDCGKMFFITKDNYKHYEINNLSKIKCQKCQR